MKTNPLYAACVRRAAELLGGYDYLGARLGIDPRTLAQWGEGIGAPGEYLFLKIIDIIEEDAFRQENWSGSPDTGPLRRPRRKSTPTRS